MSRKKRFVLLEKVMTFVFTALDTFTALNKIRNERSKQKAAVKTVRVKPRKTPVKVKTQAVKKVRQVTVTKPFKPVPSGKKIQSALASQMLINLKNNKMAPVSQHTKVDGKKSLAWIMWALGVAEKTQMKDGISIHDVSSFLYHAAQIEIYPINVSRMVHDHNQYIQQVSQVKKTKRYLLTKAGKKMALDAKLLDIKA